MKIIKCDPIMNGKAHSVKLDNGLEATAWNDKVDSGRLMQAYANHEEIELEIRPYTSKTGKTGYNIVAIKDLPISIPTQTAKAEYGNVAPKLYSQKDISIIAQVMVKAVMGQPLNFANDLKTVKDAVEMYKEAVKLLEE